MIYNYNKKLIPNAQTLRKNMTAEKKHLWHDFFKKLQKNIGNYIVDFFIANNRIVIQLDRLQHGMPENRKADEKEIPIYSISV